MSGNLNPALLTTTEVAERLRVATSTLELWRYQGRGPRFMKIGRQVRYAAADIDAWLAAQSVGGGGAP